jgi:hypothetical protein
MFDHMDGIMQDIAQKWPQWQEDFYFAMTFGHQMLLKVCAEVTLTMVMLSMPANILHSFQILLSFRMWDKSMDINSQDKSLHTTQYQEGILNYMENEYCTIYKCLPLINSETGLSNNPLPKCLQLFQIPGSVPVLVETWNQSNTIGFTIRKPRPLSLGKFYYQLPAISTSPRWLQ